jgi:hypothetical protein
MNFNKTQCLEFRTKHYYDINTEIKCSQKYITIVTTTKFLASVIDDTLSWKQHTDQAVGCVLLAVLYKT